MADAKLPKILLVEDDAVFRMLVKRLVAREFQIVEAATLKDARELLVNVSFSCVLLDYRLPDGTGFDLLPYLVEFDLPAIMMTALGHPKLSEDARTRGCHDCLPKEAFTRENLVQSLNTAMSGN